MGAATLTEQTIASVADLDREDVRRAQDGDTAAFERVYRRHAARVHSLCSRMLSPDEADDLLENLTYRLQEWTEAGLVSDVRDLRAVPVTRYAQVPTIADLRARRLAK